jgi:hypothetical protein
VRTEISAHRKEVKIQTQGINAMKKIISFLIIMSILLLFATAAYAQNKKVFVNSNQISGKQSGGKSVAGCPDVAKTPPSPPAGPIPIPYPNTSFSKDTQSGSKKVKLEGQEIKLKNKASIPGSEGDEAPTTETKKLKPRQQPATLKP